MESKKVIFAGGGTAGHIQPALAVAKLWQETYPDDQITFLGTSSGLETTLVPAAGFELALIKRVRVPRRFTLAIFRIPLDLLRSIQQSKRIMKGSDLLIGFGGYVCAPAYLAARTLNLPFVIHEANAKPGWANRLGARFTTALAVGNPVHDGPFSGALITGLPLRADVATVLEVNLSAGEDRWIELRKDAKEKLGFDRARALIFIFGGSQGSQAINAVIEAAQEEICGKGIQILHSIGGGVSIPASTQEYHATAYVDEMAQAYLAADLIISRSGAITCSEVGALGKFALFIPLPNGNGEQFVNAQHLIRAGAAMTLDQINFTAPWLIQNIELLLEKSSHRSALGSQDDLAASAKIVALGYHQFLGSEQVKKRNK